MESRRSVQWHSLDKEVIFRQVEADDNGLTDPDAQERLRKFGPNAVGSAKRVGLLPLAAKQLKSPLVYLLAAAAVSLTTGTLVDALAITVVVVLNTVLSTIQEWRAERSLEALRQLAAPKARVRRNGQDREIPTSEVVLGDIPVLETGDRVAADSRVLESEDLQTNDGTSTPHDRGDDPLGKPCNGRGLYSPSWIRTEASRCTPPTTPASQYRHSRPPTNLQSLHPCSADGSGRDMPSVYEVTF